MRFLIIKYVVYLFGEFKQYSKKNDTFLIFVLFYMINWIRIRGFGLIRLLLKIKWILSPAFNGKMQI